MKVRATFFSIAARPSVMPDCCAKQQKSREGGPRQASHFEAAYEVLQLPRGPIILLEMSVRPAAISSPRIGGCIAIRTAPLF